MPCAPPSQRHLASPGSHWPGVAEPLVQFSPAPCPQARVSSRDPLAILCTLSPAGCVPALDLTLHPLSSGLVRSAQGQPVGRGDNIEGMPALPGIWDFLSSGRCASLSQPLARSQQWRRAGDPGTGHGGGGGGGRIFRSAPLCDNSEGKPGS